MATTVILHWNASTDPTVNNYILGVGRTPDVYDYPGSPFSVGNVLHVSFVVPSPEDGIWYFAVKAQSPAGISVIWSDPYSMTFSKPRSAVRQV